MGKVRYCAEPKNAPRSCKAAGVDLPTHYKNMYNCARAVKGMELGKAFSYLDCPGEEARDSLPPVRRWRWSHAAGERVQAHAGSLAGEERQDVDRLAEECGGERG